MLVENGTEVVHMSDRDPLAGKDDQVAGKGRELAGDVTGDEDLEAKGKGQQTKGKLEGAAEDVKEKAQDLLGRGENDDQS
jgi:uncharacterized protein YjbJ (UPF0337 family)